MFILRDRLSGRFNNYDFIRFIAATLVIVSHAYHLSGFTKDEPLAVFSGGQTDLGQLGVLIFFVISGFLIAQSYERNPNAVTFLKARVLRIMPALVLVIIFTVFILGPVVTDLSLRNYFINSDTYNYLFSIFLYPMQYELPGVFENNPFPGAVNGSLWTLAIEFTFYFCVLFSGIFRLLNKKAITIIFIMSLALPYLYLPFAEGYEGYIDLSSFFLAGVLFYLYRDQIKFNWMMALLSFTVIILSLLFGQFHFVFAIFGSYFIFYIAYHPNINLQKFSNYGDASYGMYIFAFPIQQVISLYLHGSVTPFINFIITFPIVLLLSYSSWHFLEKPMLKLKNKKIFITKAYNRQTL